MRHIAGVLLTVGFVYGCFTSVLAAPPSIPKVLASQYDSGVQAYRQGNYTQAAGVFRNLTTTAPEAVEAHYYLAISLTQLNQDEAARQAYENVIRLAPQSQAAQLARQGLANLSAVPTALEPPPKATAKNRDLSTEPPKVPEPPVAPGTSPTPAATGIDPQLMQMMMLMNMGGGNGGMNPMMLPMMQQMMQGRDGGSPANRMDPSLIKNMMMQQMMQNFDPTSKSND